MTIINTITQNMTAYLDLLENELKLGSKYPHTDKHEEASLKDLKLALEAYCLDLAEDSTRHTHMAVSQYHKGHKRQTQTIDANLNAHSQLVDMICAEKDVTDAEKIKLKSLHGIIRDAYQLDTYHDSYSYLDNIVYNKVSHSKFNSAPVDAVKTAKILNAADGMTPSLGNNYHYRLDVLPEKLKANMWPHMHSYMEGCSLETQAAFEADITSKTDSEWRDLGICFNWQFNAPLVLVYSMPRKIDNSQSWQMPKEFPTGRDATLIALGLSMWNVIMTVEELGLKSCCLKAFNPKALAMIDAESDDVMTGFKWEPIIFLCIGEGVQPKGDHRAYKPKGIVNTLSFQ